MAHAVQRLVTRLLKASGLLRDPSPEPPPRPLPPPAFVQANTEWHIAYEAVGLSRERFWRRMGALQDEALLFETPLPTLGDPPWPTQRRECLVVLRSHTRILATEGISDPFTEAKGDGVGYGMEMFLETRDPPLYEAPTVEALAAHWTFLVLQAAANVAVAQNGIRADIDDFGVITSEIPDFSSNPAAALLPPRFLHEDGALGMVFGVPAKTVLPEITDPRHPPVRLISVGLLTAAELEVARRRDRGFRKGLREHLIAHGGHVIDFDRKSFV